MFLVVLVWCLNYKPFSFFTFYSRRVGITLFRKSEQTGTEGKTHDSLAPMSKYRLKQYNSVRYR